MFFSGFWCQGDGASFVGAVDDWGLFFKHIGETDGMLLRLVSGNGGMGDTWDFRTTRPTGGYVHPNSVGSEIDVDEENPFDQSQDPLRYAAMQLVLDRLDVAALETQWLKAFRYLMDELYKDLEQEHDYLTSDEEVATYILELDAEELVDPDEEEETQETCAF